MIHLPNNRALCCSTVCIKRHEASGKTTKFEFSSHRNQYLRQKAELLATDDAEPVTGDGRALDFASELNVSDEEVEVTFLREKQRRAQP